MYFNSIVTFSLVSYSNHVLNKSYLEHYVPKSLALKSPFLFGNKRLNVSCSGLGGGGGGGGGGGYSTNI